jgi:hypothetical protein
MGFEHGRNRIAAGEISVTDNRSGNPACDCGIRTDLLGHGFEKLDFADRPQLLGTAFSITVVALDRDR